MGESTEPSADPSATAARRAVLDAMDRRRRGAQPILGRPWLDVATDTVRAGIYVALILWAYYEPSGAGAFVFGGVVLADVTSWAVFSLGDMFLRPVGFAMEVLGFAGFLAFLSRVGAFEITIGQEGEALAVGFLSYFFAFWVKFAAHWLRKLEAELAEE